MLKTEDLQYPSFNSFYQNGFEHESKIYSGQSWAGGLFSSCASVWNQKPNFSEYDTSTEKTLDNAHKYATRMLTQSSTGFLSSFLSGVTTIAQVLPKNVTYNAGSTLNVNVGTTTINKREKKDSDNKDSNTLYRVAVAVLGTALLGACAYYMARSDNNLKAAEADVKAVTKKQGLYQACTPTLGGLRYVTVLHARILDREIEDYKHTLNKAMVGAAIGAAMAAGSVFGAVLIMQTGVVGAIFFSGYVIYDYTRNTNGKENSIDANILINVLTELLKNKTDRNNSPLLNSLCGTRQDDQEQELQPMQMDETNWETARPPAYEEAIRQGSLPVPSAPELFLPPAYKEMPN